MPLGVEPPVEASEIIGSAFLRTGGLCVKTRPIRWQMPDDGNNKQSDPRSG